jgi:hypothetical protein
MAHPIVRTVVAVLAVAAVLLGLKLFGLAPDDVYAPRGNEHISTPFGSYWVSSERSAWFRPLLLAHLLSVPAMWRLCGRLGYSGWFSLAMLVPLANILLLYFLAFAEWPPARRPTTGPADFGNGPPGLPAGARKAGEGGADLAPESSPGPPREGGHADIRLAAADRPRDTR